jgi:RHH-type proline utilization regulon transcriptional repressor/proline dehydrogenase/delta 1-pyrroline-5-carboxylate dehydrogenase
MMRLAQATLPVEEDRHALPPPAAAVLRQLRAGLGPDDRAVLDAAARSLARWAAEEFGAGHDPSGLRAEANVLRYRPRPGPVVVRVDDGVSDATTAIAVLAAAVAGVEVRVSSCSARPHWHGAPRMVTEEEPSLDGIRAVRLLGGGGPALWRAAAGAMVEIDDTPVMANGRLELLRWYREQAVSVTLHRYGNVVDRRSPASPGVVRTALG